MLPKLRILSKSRQAFSVERKSHWMHRLGCIVMFLFALIAIGSIGAAIWEAIEYSDALQFIKSIAFMIILF
jgi:hypothetical protein